MLVKLNLKSVISHLIGEIIRRMKMEEKVVQ